MTSDRAKAKARVAELRVRIANGDQGVSGAELAEAEQQARLHAQLDGPRNLQEAVTRRLAGNEGAANGDGGQP